MKTGSRSNSAKRSTHASAITNAVQPKKGPAGGLVVGGVSITHPDRVISDLGQITKGELAEYHARVAAIMLPGIARHPLSLLRCPSGIDGDCFYQRNPGQGLGSEVLTYPFVNKGKAFKYLYIESVTGLLQLIQMGAIELHPWGATIDAIDYPDRMIFDLDPAPDVNFDAVKEAAMELRERLLDTGLQSRVKCTGGKGLHVTVPLSASDEWAAVKTFASSIGHAMVDSNPQTYTVTMAKARRSGKIFIDFLRNDYTATAIADYSARARPGAPVAMPIEWTELSNLKSSSEFTMRDVLKTLGGNSRATGGTKVKAQRLPRSEPKKPSSREARKRR